MKTLLSSFPESVPSKLFLVNDNPHRPQHRIVSVLQYDVETLKFGGLR
jgi:hypothetical protein